jgi:DeoR/GlpR family transcriptional regulator of sugar metabolism
MALGVATNVYVLADSSKLGLRPFHAWARLAMPWILVSDDGADESELPKFQEAGLHVESDCAN